MCFHFPRVNTRDYNSRVVVWLFSCGSHCQTFPHSICTVPNSYSPKECKKTECLHIPASLLVDTWWWSVVVLICISLMINDVCQIYMCLLAFPASPLVKCPSHPFWSFAFTPELSTFFMYPRYQFIVKSEFYKYMFPLWLACFPHAFWWVGVFNFGEV